MLLHLLSATLSVHTVHAHSLIRLNCQGSSRDDEISKLQERLASAKSQLTSVLLSTAGMRHTRDVSDALTIL